jgi:hypothetical protein
VKARIALFLAFVAFASHLGAAYWLHDFTLNTPDRRRAFLLGMTYELDKALLEKFWPNEEKSAAQFDAVARLYAGDLGITVDGRPGNNWKFTVTRSLDSGVLNSKLFTEDNLEARVAFLAGAYARWGTETGFKITGHGKALAIVHHIAALNDFDVQLTLHAGYPGNSIVTVTGTKETPAPEFFTLMRQIAASIEVAPNGSLGPVNAMPTPGTSGP